MKEEVISKKELIGLNHNRNMIVYIISIFFIIIGTKGYASGNWKGAIVAIFGGLILYFQINYLIDVGNKYKELCKK